MSGCTGRHPEPAARRAGLGGRSCAACRGRRTKTLPRGLAISRRLIRTMHATPDGNKGLKFAVVKLQTSAAECAPQPWCPNGHATNRLTNAPTTAPHSRHQPPTAPRSHADCITTSSTSSLPKEYLPPRRRTACQASVKHSIVQFSRDLPTHFLRPRQRVSAFWDKRHTSHRVLRQRAQDMAKSHQPFFFLAP